MKAVKFNFILAVLMFLLLFWPGAVSARTRFYIGFGTSFGHGRCGPFGHHPYYRWHSGYYNWLDRDRYLWLDRHRYSDWYWPGYSPGTHIRIEGCWPVWVGPQGLCQPRVVTGKQIIAAPEYYQYKPGYNENTAKLFDKLRQKKSELLKTLKIADKAKRTEAIAELAGFSFDDEVRGALEDILLKDPDPDLRREVVKSLSKVKNKKVIPALEKVRVADSDKQVREQADKAIKIIKGY